MKWIPILTALILTTAVTAATAADSPNIIVIMTDDSGYADLGCYGGEIDTPNLDRMAANGLRFRNFYNNGRCSPTRATLLTGRDSAHAGFAAGTLSGWRNETKRPAYRARMPYDLPTVAELLKAAGYQTMMAGKWHLGGSFMKNSKSEQERWKKSHPGWELTEAELQADFNALPLQRGFDSFFGILGAEDHQFFTVDDEHRCFEGNQPAKLRFDREYHMHCYYGRKKQHHASEHHGKTAKAFYGTDGMTDRAIEMIGAAAKNPEPFFMFMAYRAPHLPLQAPQELVTKYLPRYANLGRVEKARVDGLVREGLWEKGTPYQKSFGQARKMSKTQKADVQLRAALHAAMVEKIDENVGKVVRSLEALDELDNTLIVYLSDNGAAVHLGDLMNVPYRGSKAQMWEGGTKTHCIAHWPKVIQPGAITENTGWVGDILPTCLELAGATYPAEFRGTKTEPLDGRSLLPVLKGKERPAPEYLFSNDRGQQGVIHRGRWKLLIEPGWYPNTKKAPGIVYELYDLKNDPAETRNLASQKPEMVQDLRKACEAWQQRCKIVDHAKIREELPSMH